MSDVIYVLLTLVVFVLLALLVGLLDRLTGGTPPRVDATASAAASSTDTQPAGTR